MQDCLRCRTALEISEFSCPECGLSYRGRFPRPRLSRLSATQQRLVELLVLHGGNLKAMERQLDLSYPTVRKRVNELQSALAALQAEDELAVDRWLGEVEAGTMTAEQAARCIEALNGGS